MVLLIILGLSKSLEVGGSGGNNVSRLSRDHSTIWVANKTSVGPDTMVTDDRDGSDSSSSSEVSLGLGNLGGVSRDYSAIGVGNKWACRDGVGGSIGGGGDHSSVGVGHQLGRGSSNKGRENQKLHDDVGIARAQI